VAEVVDISNVTANGLTVNNVWVALDCYLSVNPGGIQAQLMGGIAHGLNAALYGRQSFVNGAAQYANYFNNRVMKITEMPTVAVTLIPNPQQSTLNAQLGGVGELGVPTIAPALANAYFQATGTRIVTLPFFPNAVMPGLPNPGPA
jgi:isoquinoline 1-oxidoreductase beta subunit